MALSRFATALMVSLVVLSGCQPCAETVDVPTEVQGLWVTTDERYAERTFEITAEDLFFQTGQRDYTVHRIHAVAEEHDGGGAVYVFDFRGQSGERESFRVEYRGNGELYFPNQPLLRWTRADPAADRPWRIPGQD